MNKNRFSEPPLLQFEPFKGLNTSVTPTQINQSQSPDMLNMKIGLDGALEKRTGFERVFPTSLGAGAINGLYEYRKVDGTVLFLLAHGTKLYTQSGNLQPVEIYNGVANDRVDFFVMNNKCYIMDGVNYLVYDGATVSPVTPYVPTLSVSKLPAGGGTANEDFNLLGAGFKDSFSADGTATVYQLSLTNLDATAVTAVVNNENKTEGTHFTVDRASGKVTFTTAPTVGTNNVVITAYKTQAGFADRIKKCRFHTLYGGTNDTRIFVSGNPDFPNQMWRLGLYDPTYAPENGFYKVGSDSEKIQGFSKQYDYLVIHKEYSIWNMGYELNAGVPSFPIKPLNDQIGTIAKDSVQVIENTPVFLSKNGVYTLLASNVRDERNVQHVSKNIDSRLLKESNIDKAVSIDYDKKYWISINGNVYIYDYSISEWYRYDNIKAHCLIERNRDLYFGSSEEGLLYRFKKNTDLFPYNDDGKVINAYWMSAKISFSAAERNKLIQKLFATLEPMKNTSANFYYVSDMTNFPKNSSNLPNYANMHYGKSFYNTNIFNAKSEFIDSSRNEWFDYERFDYSRFSYNTSEEPTVVSMKVKAKKVAYYQLVVQNTRMDEGLKLDSLALKFIYQNYRK